MQMRMMGRGVLAVLLMGVVACGPLEPQEQDEAAAQAPAGEAGLTPLSSEELAELVARAEAAQRTDVTAAFAACPGANACTGYDSCASWSAVANCGTLSACTMSSPYCRQCEYDPELHRPICWNAPSQKQTQYKYRTCFNAFGQACTNVVLTLKAVCGACGDI